MDFEVKKLKIETLGEYLQSVRQDLGLDILSVYKQTGVPARCIEHLEAGQFTGLPEQVYVAGFLKKIAECYGVPAKDLISQYQREASIASSSQPFDATGKSWKVLAERLVPRRWALFAGILVALVLAGAIASQVWLIGRVPKLVVSAPMKGATLTDSLVTVSGWANPGSEVLVNGQTVFAGGDGNFTTSISALPGVQQLLVTARSRFGKTATQAVNFMVSSAPGQTDSRTLPGPIAPPVIVGVSVPGGVIVRARVVDRDLAAASSEGTYYWSSDGTLWLSTTDAGRTNLWLNGSDVGSLGKPGEVLENVPFTPDGKKPLADRGQR